MTPLQPATLQAITRIFDSLDYQTLGPVYCDEGGDAFWEERRGPCQELGTTLAAVLRDPPPPGGRSLYLGARVAELPPLVMGKTQLHRTGAPYNPRAHEGAVLHPACTGPPFEFQAKD